MTRLPLVGFLTLAFMSTAYGLGTDDGPATHITPCEGLNVQNISNVPIKIYDPASFNQITDFVDNPSCTKILIIQYMFRVSSISLTSSIR